MESQENQIRFIIYLTQIKIVDENVLIHLIKQMLKLSAHKPVFQLLISLLPLVYEVFGGRNKGLLLDIEEQLKKSISERISLKYLRIFSDADPKPVYQ